MGETTPCPSEVDVTDRQIVVSGLRFHYPEGEFSVSVSSLVIHAGEAVAILGPSGCGKSTLLRLITGLLVPDSGRVQLGADELCSLSPHARREFRLQRIGLVFQDFALLDYLTVKENILLPVRLGGLANHQVAVQAENLAERLEIGRHWNRLASELSQGERQRVAIARALVHQPAFVFADEPTASLDARRRDLVGNLLLEYARERRAPMILVTHDPALQSRFDRALNFEELAA